MELQNSKMLKIITYPDPVLRKEAEPIIEINDSFREFVDEMTEVMYEDDGVGLAANQVGILKRVIVLDGGEGLIKIINPEIIQQSEEKDSFEEGCLSLPDIQVKLSRPTSVVVAGRDLQNQPVKYRAEGLLARVFQHEIDHLNGVLIIDRVSSIQRSLLKSKLKRLEKQAE